MKLTSAICNTNLERIIQYLITCPMYTLFYFHFSCFDEIPLEKKNSLAENGLISLQFHHCGKVETRTQVIVPSDFSQEQRETKQ